MSQRCLVVVCDSCKMFFFFLYLRIFLSLSLVRTSILAGLSKSMRACTCICVYKWIDLWVPRLLTGQSPVTIHIRFVNWFTNGKCVSCLFWFRILLDVSMKGKTDIYLLPKNFHSWVLLFFMFCFVFFFAYLFLTCLRRIFSVCLASIRLLMNIVLYALFYS